jgi:hypothetical protein
MNDLVSCPYNQSHKVKQFKILAHIHSCKDKSKYKPGEFLTCRSDISVLYHITRKIEHELNCKACLGEDLEPIPTTDYSMVSDGTVPRIDLSLNENSILFDIKNIQSSEEFYKDDNIENSVINKSNTIIY